MKKLLFIFICFCFSFLRFTALAQNKPAWYHLSLENSGELINLSPNSRIPISFFKDNFSIVKCYNKNSEEIKFSELGVLLSPNKAGDSKVYQMRSDTLKLIKIRSLCPNGCRLMFAVIIKKEDGREIQIPIYDHLEVFPD